MVMISILAACNTPATHLQHTCNTPATHTDMSRVMVMISILAACRPMLCWLQCVAVCCSVLQCVAACCSLLQCVKCVETLREIAVKYIEQRGNFYRHPCRRVACVADMLQCVCVLQVCCRCVADVLQVCYRCVADVLQRMSNTLKSM